MLMPDEFIPSKQYDMGDSANRAVPCRWTHSEHNTLVALLKKNGKKWQEIAEIIGTKNEQQCRTRGLIMFNKLKRCNYDPELYQVLKVPTRAGESIKPEYVMNADGTPKRDKNGKLVRKRRPKPKNTLEIKDEEDREGIIIDDAKPEATGKKSSNKKRKTVVADKSGSQVSDEDGAQKSSQDSVDDKKKDETYRATCKKPTTPIQTRVMRKRIEKTNPATTEDDLLSPV
jgi:hypothetical protein